MGSSLPGGSAQAAAAAAVANSAAASANPVLPPGLQLPPASSASDMEEQLTQLMGQSLRLLLPPQQYSSLMEQLGVVFGRHVRGEGVSEGQLKTLYWYVQAAVDGGHVFKVLSTLEDRLGRLM